MRIAGLVVLAAVAVGMIVWLGRDDEAGHVARDREAAGEPAVVRAPKGDAAPEAATEGSVARALVVDLDQRPIEGARVVVLENGEPTDRHATSDAEGRVALDAGEDRWLHVKVSHPEFVATDGWIAVEGDDPSVLVLRRGAPFSVVVLTPDKRPVAGARVIAEVHRVEGVYGVWGWRDSDRLGAGTTNAEGRVALGGMPEGDLALTVDAAGFAIHRGVVDVRGVAPFEHVVVLDHGGRIEGRVFSPEGEPVAGARVKIRGLARPEATTGEDGGYVLEDVSAGMVRLIATADGFGPGYFGDRLGWGEPVPVTVRVGDTLTGIDIVLGRATYLVGRIVDDRKQPVPDVSVHGWIDGSFFQVGPATTDADGRFRVGPFALREPGTAQLWFEAGAHVVPVVEDKTARPGEDLDVGTVEATRMAVVRGVVLDGEGRPVPDATVSVRPSFRGVRTDAEGRFEVVGVAPGKATISAGTQSPVTRSRPLAREFGVGEVVDGVELRLLPVTSIKGRVITPDGKPRPRIVIAVEPLDWEEPAVPGIVFPGEITLTGDDGGFELPGLIEGRYRVGVVGSRGSFTANAEFETDPAPQEVRAGADDVEFEVPFHGGIVTGHVVSRRDGRAVRSFKVGWIRYKLFFPQDADWGAYEDPEGRFRTELEAGKWAVEVSADGYAPKRSDTFTLEEGETRDLGAIRLGDPGTIAGTVRDAQGLPVPYARINILNSKFQTNPNEPFTDIDGRFELRGVSPDTYSVFAVSPRHPLGIRRGVKIEEGKRTDVAIDFVAPAPLTITVVGAGGRPLKGAELSFTFPAIAPLSSKLFRDKIPPGYGSHVSDEAGVIVQPCLPPGTVTLTFEAEGYDAKTVNVELKAGEPNHLRVHLLKRN